MNTLYLECAMGAAGDMLMGALYELYPEKEEFLRVMNRLLPGVSVKAEPVCRQGVAGTHMRVTVHGQEEGYVAAHGHNSSAPDSPSHAHRSLSEVQSILDGLPLPETVRRRAGDIYGRIAQAEGLAHGVPVGEVHFHEVGMMDAIADVAGVCYLMEKLAPARVVVSSVHVGGGTVSTAHGVLPVPAPATQRLLEGIPISSGPVDGELCTPTGAALLAGFATSFGSLPSGRVLACGYGCGTKEFPRANCLRAFLLEAAEETTGKTAKEMAEETISPNDMVTELKANLDDMTAEELGYAIERLWKAGALDVSAAPLSMKKNRPGWLLVCLCAPQNAGTMVRIILAHTSTFGVRRTDCPRYALSVSMDTVPTAYGAIARKTGRGYGLVKSKPEYADLAVAALSHGVPLAEVKHEFYRKTGDELS